MWEMILWWQKFIVIRDILVSFPEGFSGAIDCFQILLSSWELIGYCRASKVAVRNLMELVERGRRQMMMSWFEHVEAGGPWKAPVIAV